MVIDKSVNTNETPLGENQFIENNLINNIIDVDPILKEINGSITSNDKMVEIVIANLHANVNYIIFSVIMQMIQIVGCMIQWNIYWTM